MSFPARTAIGFHFVDYVVHGWDVAVAIGVPARSAPEPLHGVLPYVREVPDGAGSRVPPRPGTDRRRPPGPDPGPPRPLPLVGELTRRRTDPSPN